MELNFAEMIQEYAVLPVALMCFIVGYAIKHYITVIPNNFIPLILGALGVVSVLWLGGWVITFDVILGGLCSAGLAVLAHQTATQLRDTHGIN